MENPFTNKPIRPTFITILCILTFIGSGWGAMSNLVSTFTFNSEDALVQIEQMSNSTEEMSYGSTLMHNFVNSSIEMLKLTAEYGREIAIINLILNIVSLIGAILMYNLQRSGFYTYAAAQLLMLFVVSCFAGFSPLVLIAMISSAIPTIVFIVLYAVNLKHMH